MKASVDTLRQALTRHLYPRSQHLSSPHRYIALPRGEPPPDSRRVHRGVDHLELYVNAQCPNRSMIDLGNHPPDLLKFPEHAKPRSLNSTKATCTSSERATALTLFSGLLYIQHASSSMLHNSPFRMDAGASTMCIKALTSSAVSSPSRNPLTGARCRRHSRSRASCPRRY